MRIENWYRKGIKIMKKFLTAVIAAAMICSMNVGVFAAADTVTKYTSNLNVRGYAEHGLGTSVVRAETGSSGGSNYNRQASCSAYAGSTYLAGDSQSTTSSSYVEAKDTWTSGSSATRSSSGHGVNGIADTTIGDSWSASCSYTVSSGVFSWS